MGDDYSLVCQILLYICKRLLSFRSIQYPIPSIIIFLVYVVLKCCWVDKLFLLSIFISCIALLVYAFNFFILYLNSSCFQKFCFLVCASGTKNRFFFFFII